MRATTTPVMNRPAAPAWASDASSFTITGPMFMSPNASSDAINR